MVNTVGSREIKRPTRTWLEKKRNLDLTPKQRSLIIGSLLGDGTMWLGKNNKNVNFKVEQGLAQKELVFWRYEILKPIVFTGPKISYRYRENGEKYQKSWWFRTISHPQLTEIYRTFYTGNGHKTGRKIVPDNIEEMLDPFALANLIMDDGCYNCKSIDISTYSFLLREIKILQSALKSRYGIEIRYHKDRDKGYRMRFSVENTEKLIKVIQPYFISSMEYKLGFR